MAGHARYTAVLDACVLYSIAMTDALLSLATAGLYAAKWTTRIEDEWIRALENSRPDLAGRLDVRRDCMRAAVPDWEVVPEQWQRLDLAVELPDPDSMIQGQTTDSLFSWRESGSSFRPPQFGVEKNIRHPLSPFAVFVTWSTKAAP